MELTLPSKLSHFDIYFNGSNYGGKCESFTLPTNAKEFETLTAGGLSRPIKIPVGYNEDFTVQFSVKGLDLGLLIEDTCGINEQTIIIRGSLEVADSCEAVPFKGIFTGQLAEYDGGAVTTNELGDGEATFNLVSAEYVLNGEEIYYEHALNMVRRINGVDKLAAKRAHLGRQ